MFPSQIEFLQHILNECSYLQKEYQNNDFEEFLHDERLIKAVCRSIEIIGEASNKIHPDIKIKYPDIPWRELSDIRNKIIHHYFGVDYDIIWDVLKTDIPSLKESIEIIIEREKTG